MVTRPQTKKSAENFSFPEMEFEFGNVTPGSPKSPADHLFLNGRLLPHDFPCPPAKSMSSLSRSISQTSSVSSKDSLMSSRSNSTSSTRSSSCSSSARTSTSDGSERKILMTRAKSAGKRTGGKDIYQSSKPVLIPQYGSQRWQFITQTPVLCRKVSRRNKAENGAQEVSKGKKEAEGKRNGRLGFYGFCRRFFSWFVSACNECHAISPTRRESVFQGSIVSQ